MRRYLASFSSLIVVGMACGCTAENHGTADAGSSPDASPASSGGASGTGGPGTGGATGKGGAMASGGRDASGGRNESGGSTPSNGGAKESGGATSNGGSTVSSGGKPTSNDGGNVTPPGSTLPLPPGPSNVPAPSGSEAHLVTLPWAGFKSAVSYTFDDSQPSQIAHYADLAATGVRATYYVTTASKGLANYDATWKKAAKAGNEIGNHTVDHCNRDLTNCSSNPSAASVDAEIDQCSAYIQTNLGQPTVWTMAFPYGDTAYEPDAKKRFFLARGVGGGMIAPLDSTDPFNLPCMAAAGGEAATPFSDAIDAAHSQGKWLVFLFHSLLPGDNWYAGVDIGSVTTSIEHGKSLGDAWLDTVANVGAYWVGQKLVQSGASGAPPWHWTLPAHFPPGQFVRVKVDGGRLLQGGRTLPWNGHGFYEVSLDEGELDWSQ